MMKTSFLKKLREEGRLEFVEPSDEICKSYLSKSGDCLKSATLLMENRLFENSVSMSYYAMYNSLTALLFKAGIKCENHSGSIILLKRLFDEIKLFQKISTAKEERIDKQDYVESEDNIKLTEKSTKELLEQAEDFVMKMKIKIKQLNNATIKDLREKFKEI